jgi:rhamnose transport system substrate-binding protein
MRVHKRALASIAVVALIASACGSDDDNSTSEATDAPTEATGAPAESTGGDGGGEEMTSDLSITFLPKNLGNPYFDTSGAGGARAIEEFGGEYSEVGPDAATPDAQVPFINTATQQGVDALVVSANDPNALCDALNLAR